MTLLTDGIVQAIKLLVSGSGDLYEIILLSFQVSVAACGLSILAGLPLAYLLSRKRFMFRNLIISLINTGMALPPVVVGLLVVILLWRSGPLGFLQILYTPVAMVIAQVIISFPVITGLSIAAFSNLMPEFEMQVLALGATRIQKYWLILKEVKLSLLAALIAGFGSIISEVGAVIMVGGNIKGETRVLTSAVVLETGMGKFDTAIALGIILLAITFMINGALTMVQQREKQ